MPETAKFNIGGQHYEVSRSLLEEHPDSMLAKSVSERWQEDPEVSIFIERDGLRFRYVLDYLRDGQVDVPATESKEMILHELEYYGINFDKKHINDVPIVKAKLFDSARLAMSDLEGTVRSSEVDYRCALLALDCIKGYKLHGGKKSCFRIDYKDFNTDSNFDKLKKIAGVITWHKKVDKHLSYFKLKIKETKDQFSFGSDSGISISLEEY